MLRPFLPGLIALSAVIGLTALACDDAPTAALITVHDQLGEDVQSVYVELRDATDQIAGEHHVFPRAKYGAQFSFGVEKAASDPNFIVAATALSCTECAPETAGEDALLTVKKPGRFLSNKTVKLTVTLSSSCRAIQCDAGMTCDADSRRCQPIMGEGPVADAGEGGVLDAPGDSGVEPVGDSSAPGDRANIDAGLDGSGSGADGRAGSACTLNRSQIDQCSLQ